jgi:hypothetical protein
MPKINNTGATKVAKVTDVTITKTAKAAKTAKVAKVAKEAKPVKTTKATKPTKAKKAAPVEEPAEEVEEENEEAELAELPVKASKKRYFKRIDMEDKCVIGRYKGSTPMQAASNSFSQMVRNNKKNNDKGCFKTDVFIVECTRGSAKKVYGYHAQHIKLDVSTKIEHKHKWTTTSVNEDGEEVVEQHEEPMMVYPTKKWTETVKVNGKKITKHMTGPDEDAEKIPKVVEYHFRNKLHKIKVPAEVHDIAYNRKDDEEDEDEGDQEEAVQATKKAAKAAKPTKAAKATKATKTAKATKVAKVAKTPKATEAVEAEPVQKIVKKKAAKKTAVAADE